MYKDSLLINKIKNALPIPVFELAQVPMAIVDQLGLIVTVNSEFTKMTGLNRKELVNKSLKYLYNENDQDSILDQHYDFIKNECEYEKRDLYLLNSVGDKVNTQETSIKFSDEDDNLYRLVSFIDKNNLKNGEYLKSILFNIAQIVNTNEPIEKMIIDIQDRISYIFPADNFIFVYNNSKKNRNVYNSYSEMIEIKQIKNYNIDNFIDYLFDSQLDGLLTYKQIKQLIDTKKIEILNKIPQLAISVPILINSEMVGLILIQTYNDPQAYDENTTQIMSFIAGQLSRVLERKIYEEQLILAKLKAEESEKIKTAFLSQMSHEIRTPLSAILSFVALIKSDIYSHLTPDLDECFLMIENGGKRLMRTFDLILSAAGVLKGEYKPDFTTLSIDNEILRPLVSRFQKKAEEKDISLSLINLLNDDHIKVFADFSSISQIFINLIDNAIKYTDRGKVEVILFRNDKNEIQVDIKDTGIGIAEEYIPALFDYFTQEEIGYTRKYDGNGLGLALVKEYAKINNLTLEVKSKKDSGSTFTVIL